MIILDATTKSLQLKLGGSVTTNQLPFAASYVDSTGATTTPGEQDGTSNNTTAVTVVSSPASSTQRLVKNIIIQNADTASATVTVIYNNNSTLRNVFNGTLSVGDQLVYEDGQGWACLDKFGNTKTTGGGSGSPGGSNGQVQYNNAGAFGGLANGQLPGTATNDNASSGNVGEWVSSTVNSASAVSLTTGTSTNITSISLTAGDWDIGGKVGFVSGTGTDVGLLAGDINTTSAAAYAADTACSPIAFSIALNNISASVFAIDTRRISISGTTSYYLNCLANFSNSTLKAYGIIWARRAR